MTNSSSNEVTNATESSALTAIGDLVTAIDHVGLAVPDLDTAAAWWLDNFGFINQHEEVNEEQGVREAMVGPRGGDTMIQLLMPLNEESTIAKFIGRSGPGMQQMAVRVTDLDEVAKRLTAAGVRLLYPQPKRGTADSRINFVHPKDAGGVLLELVEPAASH
ncbi:methylmalonyl-CoA epimerase [Gordonia sp. (in: high G+C Gram-positive bacteria)]|uniref:methylmalonyl-CoA epimerase n=1 Tax=Gordonia sp. (in: high G+C Gram-positive bacteria) TaxID=84139 RepID=UPI0016BD62A9|nr:methylmalonyl-CoA epimerase [Gordonia sp. (in: high G+C Gram-positive bacteria)]NLG45391.1 methylmalonyl-CoA epimerase [Gordonia sp. (in: high G+C Gram-positive bacteria)]